MKRKVIRLFYCCIILTVSKLNGQTPTPIAVEKITPPTPEAAALGKFGTYPVGLFTGTPNVTIDLYKLKAKKIQVPISLTYMTNGLRVDEMPTKVGMTWVLNAGGAITRTVYDKPDEMYARAPVPLSADFSSTTSTDFGIPTWLENVEVNHQDTQFDEYSFNFNGYSGKFIVGLNNIPILIPYSNLKIEMSPLRITTPDGIQYYFGENGATESSQISSGSCVKEDSRGAKSAWYLTRIVDPNDPSDNITITYITGGYNYTANQNQTITIWDPANTCTASGGNTDPCGCGPTPCNYGGPGSPFLGVDNFCSSTQIVSIPYINEITSSLYGKIKFNYNTTYSTSTTPILIDRLLSSIQIYQNNDGTSLLKSFNLNYTLAKPSQSGKIISSDNIATVDPDINSYRPFLSNVQQLDRINSVVEVHRFEYEDMNNLAARLSSSQDYWGYYNGKANYYSFIPSNLSDGLPIAKIADRNPDYSYAVKGMLTKVTFPTGGNTQFVYEGNTSNTQSQQPSSPHYTTVPNIQANNITPTATFYILTPTTVQIDRSLICCANGVNTCALASNSLVWGQVNAVQTSTSTVLKNYSFAEYNTRGECSFSKSETITLQPGIYGLYVASFDKYQLTLTATAVSGGSIYKYDGYIPTMTSLATSGGGLRVKQQIVFDPLSQVSTTTNYQYSGMIIPNTPRYYNKISYKRQLQLWLDGNPGCQSISQAPCNPFKTCSYNQ